MNSFAIRTEALTRDFKTVRAVDQLTLDVPAGSVFGFLGPNGSGKTTTLRLLLGLIEPTSGRAEVLGFDTRTQADQARLGCGALLEHNGLYERMSAVTNLEYYARIWKIPAAERPARIQSLLTTMGLWDRRNEVVSTWSRGMKQKLAVARALLHRPALVFLDEPTAGLDPIAAAALRDDLAALSKDEGVTVFLTTHNLAEAEKLCHQVGVIREGKLLAVGRPDELRRGSSTKVEIFGRNFTPGVLDQLRLRPEVVSAQSQNGHLELDLRPDAETAPLVGLLVQHGVEIEEVRKGKASLEETFLALMENE